MDYQEFINMIKKMHKYQLDAGSDVIKHVYKSGSHPHRFVQIEFLVTPYQEVVESLSSNEEVIIMSIEDVLKEKTAVMELFSATFDHIMDSQ
jgi:hypothetical protein